MKLYEIQAAVAEATVRVLLGMKGRPADYEHYLLTNSYEIRAAVGVAVREVLQNER